MSPSPVLSVITLLACVGPCFAADATDLGGAGAPPAVVTLSESPIVAAARERLTDHLRRLTTAEPTTRPSLDESVPRAILLGDASLAKRYNLPAPDESREESFSVAPVTTAKQSLLIIGGQSDVGIKQGIYHVLRNLSLENDKLILRRATVRSSPFIKLRVSHIGGYTRQAFDRETGQRLPRARGASDEQLAENYIIYWEPPRIGQYVEMLDFFGYNGIEPPPMLYNPAERSGVPLERRRVLRDHLLRNGMVGVAKIDGTLLNDGAVPYGADTKQQYDEYYRGMAETAAPFNDIVLTHWVDAGGWKSTPDQPCTIELLQDLHVQIAGEFKRVNPKSTSILSLWNMHNPAYKRWLGYEGPETILNGGRIGRDVGIAMSKTYRPDDAKKVLAAGHPLAIWGWYTADHELTYTMHVHTHTMAEFFRLPPPEARDTVLFYSLDNCQRRFNLYSVYVGGRMLWDPGSDPEVHLREVARLVYGPRLEEPVFRALKMIADVRCGTNCRAYWMPRRSEQTNGVVSLDEGLKQSRDAWDGLKDLQVDATYAAPVRFHLPTETLLRDLKGHTQAVAAYMQFLKDEQDGKDQLTEVPRAEGPFEYYERLQYLQQRHHPTTNAVTAPTR